jgi:hypothetical protein
LDFDTVPAILLFVGQLPDYLGITPEPWTRPVFRGANIAIGIMFGLAFLAMARKAPAIKDHLTIAAIGVMIITISFGITNIQQTFGIAAHSLVLLCLPICLLLAYTIQQFLYHMMQHCDNRLRDLPKVLCLIC